MANLNQLTLKDKFIIYTRVIDKLYNLSNRGQVHEIYRIIELEKICIIIAKNLHNLSSH